MPWDNSRPTHVPTPLRKACLTRDGHQCTARLRDTGQRCPATTNIEAAHTQQWQPGERTTLDNLRTLCHWHHNRETQAEAAQARRTRRPTWRQADEHPGKH